MVMTEMKGFSLALSHGEGTNKTRQLQLSYEIFGDSQNDKWIL